MKQLKLQQIKITMNNLSFLKSILLLITLGGVASCYGQTKLWGVGATSGQAEAEFQNNFIQSTTASNYSPTAWTALSISDASGVNVPGAAYWTRNTTGVSQGTYAIAQSASSNSVANGVAIFDSDFLHTGGPGGTGTSPNHQHGALISPRMDLTGATDSALVVEFYSYYRHFDVTEYSVAISVDDGATWSTPFDIKSLQFSVRNNPVDGTLRILFPNVTAGVANLSQCRLKFTFNGRYYFTILDDVSVEIAPDYDIAIGFAKEVSGSATYGEIGDIVRFSNNTHRPLVNVNPNNLGDWIWGAKVVNYGTKTIQAADNPRIRCSIDYTDAMGNTTYGVYSDTLVGGGADSIPTNDFVGVTMVTQVRDLDFIMTHKAGTYEVTYWVEHNHMDGSAVNDTVKHSFVITDDQNGTGSYYLTKSKVSPIDNRVYGEDRFTPANLAAFEYGSIFSFPNGARDSVKIDSIDFVYHLHSSFSGPATQTVFMNIYEFVDGSNGGAADGSIEAVELTKIAFTPVELTGLGTTISTPSYNRATATNFIDPTGSGNAIQLKDNAFYYIALEINPSQTGGAATFNRSTSPFLAETRLNYAMNRHGSSSASPISATTSKTVSATGNVDFYDSIRESNTVPAIGIHLSASKQPTPLPPVPVSSIKLEVYPNPVTNYLTIDVELEESAAIQYIITDISGRVVYHHQSMSVLEEHHTIDISALPTGVYVVTAQTARGVSTKRIIHQ